MKRLVLYYTRIGGIVWMIVGFGILAECIITAITILILQYYRVLPLAYDIPAWADMPFAMTGELIGCLGLFAYHFARYLHGREIIRIITK